MASINDIKDIINIIVRQNTTGGNLDPNQFNLIINRAQITKFMRSYGNPQEYQIGNPVPRIAFQTTQAITDELGIFIKNTDIIVPSTGQLSYPSDYVHLISLGFVTGVNSNGSVISLPRPIEIVNKEFEWYRRSSKIVPPTKLDPIAIEENTYIQLYPVNLGSVKFSYLRQPREAKWAYTIASGRPVYDSANSVNLEWRDNDINSIISLAVSYIGISIKDQEVSQYAELKSQQGI